ncbi:Gfo/Idh/MocA family protein [Phycicoccus sp. Soil803]|uniref:Gfo/Idh/MocA family protein n=1 Tax=Phycicoccus sp. Soil803 TaxID=1736415 RepID=UPI0009E73CA8|nr:Gfo/Idh/MocA family oxidoreductase [Phycicoccus sp. Soil803]
MSARVRWGIVGTGGIARRTVGDLQLCDNVELVGICSRDKDRAETFASEHAIPFASADFDEFCTSGQVDAVYIGIPHGLHFDHAARALRAGVHVVCEKPLTMTSAEAEELHRLSRENGVFLMEAMWMKFTPAFRAVTEILGSGTIGEPRLIQAGAGFPVPPDGPARYWVAELGGGALYDLGVYTIALAHAVLGTPDQVIAVGEIREDGVDEQEAYTLRYDSGAVAQLTNSLTAFIPPGGWIGGTRGSITLGEPIFAPRSLRVVTGQPPAPPTVEELDFDQEGAGYVPMFRAASEAILRGDLEHGIHPVSDTVAVLRTLERVRAELVDARNRADQGAQPASLGRPGA